ncbi:MAG TPA: radical SAM family heme chaperone HemW [Chloroflexota bacterium]|nr:radical SAM family heme chaperone HemW [Chloroflexota bacterium]
MKPGVAPGWKAPSSLYIHIPFCPYKCPYCDFATYVGGDALVEPYVQATCAEIERQSAPFPGHALDTVYFGGGTPSMLTARQIGAILTAVQRGFGIRDGAEISIEANPDSVDAARLAGYRAAGINRLSIGVQSMDGEELEHLGRGHVPEDVRMVTRLGRSAGFDNISLDLIYGTPRQTMKSWAETLATALTLEPDHLSLYSLIVEPGTRFNRMQAKGTLKLPEDDLVADMYTFACDRLRDGFEHYEVANWARDGRRSAHNINYWLNEQFFAVGVGAYDYLRPYRAVRVRSTKRYIEAMRLGHDGIAHRDLVDSELERFETAIMRLRLLNEGLDRGVFRERFGESLDARYSAVLGELVSLGFIDDDGETIRLRESMVPLANEAWERFLP